MDEDAIEVTVDLPDLESNEMQQVLNTFHLAESKALGQAVDTDGQEVEHGADSGDHDDAQDAGDAMDVSKRQKKALVRLSIAELKQAVPIPEVIEAPDITAPDPILLGHLKCRTYTVPVPQHWAYKRKYLQARKGLNKQPYELPEHIADTGIASLRDAGLQADADKSLKQRTRETVRPKMGGMIIEYEKLQAAFFAVRYHPKLTGHGDLYYEDREKDHKYPEKQAGVLSERLLSALGMPNARAPPPWLINMQRYGPPRAYPVLKVPGVNAPIPAGERFGFQPGGWGQPPVDQHGRAIYGDVFGTEQGLDEQTTTAQGTGEHHLPDVAWGELENDVVLSPEPGAEASGDEADEAAAASTSAQEPVDTRVDVPALPVDVQLRRDAAAPLFTELKQEEVGVAGSAGLTASGHRYIVPDSAMGKSAAAATVISHDWSAKQPAANLASADLAKSSGGSGVKRNRGWDTSDEAKKLSREFEF